jgi:hypothetical protein
MSAPYQAARRGGAVLIAGCVAALVAGCEATARAPARNPIQAENALRGTADWDQGTLLPPTGLDGYTSQVSTVPGAELHLHVTGPSGTRYRVVVYRLGWYRGVGARRVACLPSCNGAEPAVVTPPASPPDRSTGYLDAGWPITDTIRVGSNWVSGYYIAKLVVTAGAVAGVQFIPFIVREARPSSPILVQAGINTWEAYNNYGGKSLYAYNSTHNVAATEVSFDRPYTVNWPFMWDYNLIRFLERNGYDVSYATDVDTSRGVDAPGARKLVIVSGHDEYWNKAIRDALDTAQLARVNMAFMGANSGYWQMRYSPDYRGIYEYRTADADPSPTPATKTVQFRSLTPPRPECLLEGEQYLNGYDPHPPPEPNYGVAPGALTNPWFARSGFSQSTSITGVVGYEWDTAGQRGCPTVLGLFTWSGTNTYGKPSTAGASTFTTTSGARVFAAGSLQFSWALDNYGRSIPESRPLQVFVKNMLDAMG